MFFSRAVDASAAKYTAIIPQLFCGRPTLEILERRWRRDAEFEDTLCKCRGFEEYAPLFFALVCHLILLRSAA